MILLRLAYANMMTPAAGARGIPPRRLEEELEERTAAAIRRTEALREAGELGFLDLPGDESMLRNVEARSAELREWADTLVVVGIGGSSLGGIALLQALDRAGADLEAEGAPRVRFLDNPDPDTVAALLRDLDPSRTAVNVISKSGGTAETLAGYLVLRDAFGKEMGAEAAVRHFIFTTDPVAGPLRQIATQEGIHALDVPPAVGGRFSVLSPVGLLPAAFSGLDVAAILDGASTMAARCQSAELQKNPAHLMAALLHSAHADDDRSIHVMMPYGDSMRSLALWFQQLWAESLGKADQVHGLPTGPTPLAAAGAMDQHSLLQLFMEGPDNKVVIFLKSESRGRDIPIPELHPEQDALARLAGHGLGDLLEIERRATAEGLRRGGRPSMLLDLGVRSEASVGAFFMLCQLATIQAAALYGVNPLDQPGVELGKRLTGAVLGGGDVEEAFHSEGADGRFV